MTREFGEGERNERREDETDDLQELRDRIRARKEDWAEKATKRALRVEAKQDKSGMNSTSLLPT
ncbi:MAG: hypothetical protein E6K84_00740 [Thaumarchaeota archaeon]|nr:MAG: hypothetical protein E6K84_00740 [Nitrososphaerota archaeon]